MFYEENPVVKCILKKDENVYRDTIKYLADRLEEAEISIPQMEEILEERKEEMKGLNEKMSENEEELNDKTAEVAEMKEELEIALKKIRELKLEVELEKKSSESIEIFFKSKIGTLHHEAEHFADRVIFLKKENEQLALQLKQLNEDGSQLTKK